MKNMRKLLCALLVVTTVVCFMPALAFAETGATTPGTGATTPGTGATTPGTGATTPGAGENPGTGETDPVTPSYPIIDSATGSISAEKTEANNAIKTVATAEKYEDAEQAEIQAIVEKAAKDIAAAKTAEEIKAIREEAIKAIEAIDTAEEKELIRKIEAVGKKEIIAKSKISTLNGKLAVKLTWTVPEDFEFDGFDIFRSTERYSGFGTKPFFSTSKTSYKNNKDLEVGNTYYYKVRAYKVVNGRKVYTGWSTKAWRTIK